MVDHRCSNCGAAARPNRSDCEMCGLRLTATSRASRLPEPAIDLRARLGIPTTTGGAPAAMVAVSFTGEASLPSHVDPPQAPVAPNPAPARDFIRRPLLYVPLIMLALVAGVSLIIGTRVHLAFNTINAISTPAASVSGAALGGSSSLTIDTAPAQTAVAAAAIGPDSTETEAATSEPTPAATVPLTPTLPEIAQLPMESDVPGEMVSSNTTSTAELDDKTPTPAESTNDSDLVLSEIDRIKNGGFEQADANWHLEEGAMISYADALIGGAALTIDATGGYADQRVYFVPETTYYLSLSAKLSAIGAEPGTIGINFVDADGNHLIDLQPAAVTIASNSWEDIEITFVAPSAATELLVYVWKPSGEAILTVDQVSLRSLVPEDVMTVDVLQSGTDSMAILLMGVDARPGEAIDTGVRPDTLMVLHLNAETGSCRLLAIPRDTRTELPGFGQTKVNHALAVGGIEYQTQVVELMLGLTLDHYVLIDFNGFEDLVDAVGGITVDVPRYFVSSDGREFFAGPQEMTGQAALSYARWRGGPDGDFGRIQRQQQILRALIKRASGLAIIGSINELLPALEENLRTDFSVSEMASLALDFRSRCTEETISMLRLEGIGVTYDDPLLQMPLYYIEVDQAEIRSKVAALLEP